MNETLSVIVPIFNAQNSLAKEVHELLDVLSDLSNQFELLLIDDGSTDQTGEIAEDIALEFPQVRVVRHPRRFGASAAARTGLRHATGEFVFVQDEFSPLSCTELRRLWELRNDDRPLPPPRPSNAGTIDSKLLQRLSDWGIALRKHQESNRRNGVQMIRRHAVERLRRESREELPVG